ncbi:hypothetical protein ACFQYP_27170 [Nonomuraea antimicrobica]
MAFVPRESPGLTVVDDWDGFGQRTTASGTVLLDDVFVPAAHVMRVRRDGGGTFRSFGLLIHAAIDTGIAEGALADAAAFLRGYLRAATAASAPTAARPEGWSRRSSRTRSSCSASASWPC